MILLALVALGVFFLRRRRRQKLLAATRIPHTRPASLAPSTYTTRTQSTSLRSPFGEEYAVPYTRDNDDDASRASHATTPSMSSISSTITDNSMQFLVAAHRQSSGPSGGVGMGYRDDEIIPMSRIQPSTSPSSGPSATRRQSSTYQYPSTSLHPSTATTTSAGLGLGKTKRYSGESKEPFAEGNTSLDAESGSGLEGGQNLLRRMTPLERQETG